MFEIDYDNFLGCSPLLVTTVGPLGKSGQNHKWYLIHSGPKKGIYVDQRLASSLAKTTKQDIPCGYDDEVLIKKQWMYYCMTSHDHPDNVKKPFVDPFDTVQPNTFSQSVQISDNVEVSPSPSPSPHRGKAKASDVNPADLARYARPLPHQPGSNLFSPGGGPATATRSGSIPPPRSPTKAQRPTKAASKITGVVVDNSGSGWPSSASIFSESVLSDSESIVEVETKFYVVKSAGAIEIYTQEVEAWKAFAHMVKRGWNPAMRIALTLELAREFTNQ
ncbi:hypothetical protein VKT23_009063 [Stygiomarasmius scandens]|uniref:BRCT domain-containing protein n=1 Tax=Marasmiellus scandens TaxID=2682957 RepID=A0ABR1JGC0_9AGAR